MPPVIRIDNEVYSWLQKNARPFEDTPNTVLRRIAGLEIEQPKTMSDTEEEGQVDTAQIGTDLSKRNMELKEDRTMNGRQLNEKWGVRAKHALYHKDGVWFNNLERFPGALFDPDGYILFKTEEEYLKCPYLKIGKETNVPKGIYSIPGYVKKR